MLDISSAYHQIANTKTDWVSAFIHFPWDHNLTQGVGSYWPVLVPMMYVCVLFLFTIKWFFLTNIFYLFLAMSGVYFSTKFLINNRFYSMLAAIIFSSYWIIRMLSVSVESQLFVAACVVVAFYWYLRSYFFTRFWESMLVGAFMILGLYADRVTAGFYIFALFLVPENYKRRRSLFFMFLTLVVVLISVWPFYQRWVTTNLWSSQARAILFSSIGDCSSVWDSYKMVVSNPKFIFVHLTYYFVSLTEILLGYWFIFFLAIGSIFLIWRSTNIHKQILGTAILVPLTGLILIVKKDFAYIIPLCVYWAIVTATGVYFIQKKLVRRALLSLISILIVLQYSLFLTSYPFPKQYFFSDQFGKMKAHNIPKLWLYAPLWSAMPANSLFLITDQINQIIGMDSHASTDKQTLMVDISNSGVHNCLLYLFNLGLPKIEIVDTHGTGFFSDNKFKTGRLYLLTDKIEHFNNSRSCGIYSWSSVLVKHQISFDLSLFELIQ